MDEYYENYWLEKPNDELSDLVYKWPVIKVNFPKRKHLSVLDFGCGAASLLELLVNAHPANLYFGVDVSTHVLKRAKKRLPQVSFAKISSGASLPFKDRRFDIILAADVIEHLYDTKRVLREIHRVLRQNGQLIITTPYHGIIKNLLISLVGFETVFDPQGPHIRFYTQKSLKSVLDDAGFKAFDWVFFGRFFPLWRGMLVKAIKK